jgi:hypothetical protein
MAKRKKMTKAESESYLKEMAAPVTNANSAELVHEPAQRVVMPTAEEIAELEAKNDAALDEMEDNFQGDEVRGAAPMEELQAIAEVEEDNKQNNSVVAAKFKDKYLANARANGIPGKAAKRSNWDWLSQQIAAACLDEKHKIRIPDFIALLEANGVDHSRWTNRNKGWEGRFRMTGRVALQKVVADSGELKFGGLLDPIPAPADFIERFKTKA